MCVLVKLFYKYDYFVKIYKIYLEILNSYIYLPQQYINEFIL